MSTKTIPVTVLMPVFNGTRFLSEAIESILNQTFTNFEFLIIDDGSTDDSVDIIKSYDDPRIRLVENYNNLSQSVTLNKGLDLALGKYVARMDQDDVCLPTRLEKQKKYMEKNSDVGILGCNIDNVDENLKFLSHGDRPLTYNQNKWALLTNTCLMHPTAFMRCSEITNNKYNKEYAPCEDYEFWSRLIHTTIIEQLEETLVLVRKHSSNTGILKTDDRHRNRRKISQNNIRRILGLHDNHDFFFSQYVNRKSHKHYSRIRRLIGDLQGILIYYRFCLYNHVMPDDRKWIRRNIMNYLKESKFKLIVRLLLV